MQPKEDLKSEIILLNLKDVDSPNVKIIYIFPPKDNCRLCVIEVPPNIRVLLLKDEYIFINHSACKISYYIRVLQCYRCLAFSHFAKQCKFSPVCGHYAGDHETKDCLSKKNDPVCGNCKQCLMRNGRIQLWTAKTALSYVEEFRIGSSISTMINNQTENIRICHVNCQSLFTSTNSDLFS